MPKLDVAGYDTDKAGYIPRYEKYFDRLDADRHQVRLLELGIKSGGSLQLWRDYFPNGVIAGLDIEPVDVEDDSGRIHVYQGGQEDPELLDRIARECAPDGFDIIIDDCAHIGWLARRSFWHLFPNHLRSEGMYILEDWGTGYWESWPDGKRYKEPGRRQASDGAKRFPSHDSGMVGFVKELVDECGMPDITHEVHGQGSRRDSMIREMHVSPGHVQIIKV